MIEAGQLSISEWRKTTKIIFKQMVEAVEFLHRHRVVHCDISLENFLISEAEVLIKDNERGIPQIHFVEKSIQIKLWCVTLCVCTFSLFPVLLSIMPRFESIWNVICVCDSQ